MRVVLILLLLGWMWTRESHAAPDAMVPADRQVALLLRILSYDYQLQERSRGTLRVAVVYPGENKEMEKLASDIKQAFKAFQTYTVKKMPVHVMVVSFSSQEEFQEILTTNELNTLYLTPGLDAELPKILAHTRKQKMSVVTGHAPYVKAGVPIAVRLEGNRPRIVVNMTASVDHGYKFAAQLLQLAELVD